MALPSVYFVGLQPPDLMVLRGLDLRYWSDRNDTADVQPVAPPLSASRAFNINVTWPLDGPNAPEFVAEWDGVLYAPEYGAYGFRLRSPARALLEIDGNVVLEGEAEQLTVIPLAQGNHRIRVRADSASGQVALFWQPPGRGEELVPAWALYTAPITNHGLQASFYANGNWQGQPTLQRIDPFLDSYFHLIPFNRPYTVEWAGSLVAPRTGVYRLGLRVVQEAELYLDRRLILTSSGPNQHTEAAVTLEAGLHDLLVRYRDSVDRSRVHLTWIPPNGVFEPIPSENLWPPMGSYPEPVTSVQDAGETRPFELYHLESIGSPGNQPGQFFEPRDIAVMSNGNVVVADTGNQRVQIFDPQFTHLKTLAGNEFPFEEPLAVGVSSQDEILVLDSTLQWIYRYDAAGNLLDRFGGPTAYLFHPRGLTVLDDDSLALADTGTSRILLFGPDGDPIGSIGSLGPGPGQLNEPTDVVRDVQGTYFVVEAENNRLQRLDAAGNPLAQWDIPLTFAYDGPHLDLGPDGSIFITESQSNSLLRYSSSGELINQWRTVGPINLADPVGIYFDRATNRLYVTDVGTHQVHVLWLQPISDGN
jgi:DNA-binding beta-propeller fold protein YncE